MLATSDHVLLQGHGPRLLYEPVHTTKADLLASIPPRPVVDRMVARYFNTQGVVPSILHSGHFLQEVRLLPFSFFYLSFQHSPGWTIVLTALIV
jgi:hypothetical protein